MNSIEFIKMALGQSKMMLMAVASDMKDAPLTFPTPKGGNHPLWVMGHLAISEGAIIGQFVLGEENPLAKWQDLFGGGSEPTADASKYPAWDEVMGEFERMRAATLKYLDTLSEADLDKKSKAPDKYGDVFGTVGHCFSMAALHCSIHMGQICDARRSAGRKPVFG